jgi:hypothetical protein
MRAAGQVSQIETRREHEVNDCQWSKLSHQQEGL